MTNIKLVTNLCLLLMAKPLVADPVTIYLRYGTPAGAVRVTGVSTTTPIRLTTNAAWTGLAVNDYWVTSNEDKNCTVLTGLFKVAAVTTTTLDLKSTSDVNVAGTGCGSWTEPNRNYVNGKARATLVTKFGLLDGPGGTMTRRLRCAIDTADPCLVSISVTSNVATITVADGYTDELTPTTSRIGIWLATGDVDLNGTYIVQSKNDTANTFTINTASVGNGVYTETGLTLSKYAQTNNTLWTQMSDQVTSWTPATYNADTAPDGSTYMANQLGAAIKWFITRDATALTKARIALLQVEDVVFGNTFCDKTQNLCEPNNRSSLDYSRTSMDQAAKAVRILCAPLGTFVNIAGQCTSAEFTLWERKVFAQEAEGCVYPTKTVGSGSITAAGTSLTGNGSNLSALSNGDLIFWSTSTDEGDMSRISTGGGTNTPTLTSTQPKSTTTSSWSWVPRMTALNCGIIEWQQHHNNTTLSYGTPGGKYSNFANAQSLWGQTNNLILTQLWGTFVVSMTFVDISPTARDFAQRSWAAYYDNAMAFFMSRSGLTHGSLYGRGRSYPMLLEPIFILKNYTDYPDIGWTPFVNSLAEAAVYGASPNETGNGGAAQNYGRYWLLYGQAPDDMRAVHNPEIYIIPRLIEGTPQDKWWRAWLFRQSQGLNALYFGYSSGRYPWMGFMGWNPNAPAYEDPPLTGRVFTNEGFAGCSAVGMKYCPPTVSTPALAWAASRTGFSIAAANTDWLISMISAVFFVDHDSAQHGDLHIQGGAVRNIGNCLVGDDSPDCDDGTNGQFPNGRMSTLNIGAVKQFLGDVGETGAYMDRYKVDASNRYVTWRANMRGSTTAATLTREYQWVAHMGKAGGPGMVFVIADAAASTSIPMVGYTHYTQNGQTAGTTPSYTEGNTSCIGGLVSLDCPSGQILSQSPVNTIISDYSFPSAGTLRVDNASGSYPGGFGYTSRFTYGPNGNVNIMEVVAAHRLLNGTGTTTISCNALNPTGWMGKECHGQAFLVARADASPTTVPAFTTTATNDILVSGAAAGSYAMYRNGVVVTGCETMTLGTDRTMFCPGVPAGSITAGTVAAAIDITTTSLPDGTVGSGYSQTLAITGGNPPYNCSIPVGSLPSGLTISVATISGTPTTAGTSNFTVSCTDSIAAPADTAALSIVVSAAPVGTGTAITGGATITGAGKLQ